MMKKHFQYSKTVPRCPPSTRSRLYSGTGPAGGVPVWVSFLRLVPRHCLSLPGFRMVLIRQMKKIMHKVICQVLQVSTCHHFIPVARYWYSGTKCGQPLNILCEILLRDLNFSQTLLRDRSVTGNYNKECNWLIAGWIKKLHYSCKLK